MRNTKVVEVNAPKIQKVKINEPSRALELSNIYETQKRTAIYQIFCCHRFSLFNLLCHCAEFHKLWDVDEDGNEQNGQHISAGPFVQRHSRS